MFQPLRWVAIVSGLATAAIRIAPAQRARGDLDADGDLDVVIRSRIAP
jgi:hypothetical protein